METVQLMVQAQTHSLRISALLRSEGYAVAHVDAPDLEREGPIVADRRAIEKHPDLLGYPDRVVVIAPKDGDYLSLLWQHNIRFVVFESDPPSTVMLAVLGASIGQGKISEKRPTDGDFVVFNPR